MASTATAAPRRADESILERLPIQSNDINVGDTERWASLIAGGALAIYGLSRRTLGGMGLALAGGSLLYRGATGHCNMYGLLGISTAGPQGSQASVPARRGVKLERSFTINRPAEELFRFWRNFENLPRVMRHLKS